MRIFLTGATGLIGKPLVERLHARGDRCVVLTRNATQALGKFPAGTELVAGNPQSAGPWQAAVDGCDAVINLVGEPVIGKRWNARQKQVLRDSRIGSTNHVVQAIQRAEKKPAALVSASAIGFYGNTGERECDERSGAGQGFLEDLCVEWEQAALAAEALTRVSLVRVGIVLAKEGGALAQMLLPFKLGVGGPIGLGQRWMSWIHLNDIVGIFLHALDQPAVRGPLNGTAPVPVRNKEFSQALARALHRPCLFPTPPLALRLMFGEVSDVILASQRILPRQTEASGYRFQFESCDAALRHLFGRQGA